MHFAGTAHYTHLAPIADNALPAELFHGDGTFTHPWHSTPDIGAHAGRACSSDRLYLWSLRRNPGVPAALENKMSVEDSATQKQVPDMNASQPTAPAAQGQNVPGAIASVTGASLDADLQAHIGRQLRAVYEEVVNEAVPDRLLKLLEELERKQAPPS